ncbi:MAG: N-6 DNA methylase, partial [Rhodobacteraceae bacterium]|nr:N-6 DNA methylase [Paracoccaceae bacterium]
GLPGVNRGGKVSNGNYIWMSFFHSYLSEKGRAGIVMSSQASSAGGGEAKVREALVKSGDVDIMMAIRGNFFYTRTVPCEIWFMDKGKPEAMRDKVLMLDARNVFRKVTRKVFDFSPEQMKNLSSIVWLYRGQEDRFAGLVQEYLSTARDVAQAANFAELETAFDMAEAHLTKYTDTTELKEAIATLKADAATFVSVSAVLATPVAEISSLTKSQAEMQPVVEKAKALIKEIDHLSKFALKAHDAMVAAGQAQVEKQTTPADTKKVQAEVRKHAAEGKKLLTAIAEVRVPLTGDPDVQLTVTGTLKRTRYFEAQAEWLLSRFPDGTLRDVEGLVKLVGQDELAENDYSLTPGRYVGVAPEVEDKDFDFEETIKGIHAEIEVLNAEAAELADTIAKNFEELIV